jgi:hypothetical protein
MILRINSVLGSLQLVSLLERPATYSIQCPEQLWHARLGRTLYDLGGFAYDTIPFLKLQVIARWAQAG